MKRNTYYYQLWHNHRVVYRGITKNPERRYSEHLSSGKRFTTMSVSPYPFKKWNARKYEKENILKYEETHGRKPRYNRYT